MAFRPKDTQQRILHRLKISQGQLKKVISMAEDDAYCIDILHQSQAIQKALKETNQIILENHLRGCVVDKIKKGQVDSSIEEVMKVFQKQS